MEMHKKTIITRGCVVVNSSAEWVLSILAHAFHTHSSPESTTQELGGTGLGWG